MIQPPPYLSVPDALALLMAQVGPVKAERLPLAEAEGFTLSEPLLAPDDIPPRAIAIRDGWAVASQDLVGASGYSPAALTRPPTRVRNGDVLPPGADAVLPPDSVMRVGGLVEATDTAVPGQGARRRGEDAGSAGVLRGAGRTVRGLDIAVAAAAGVETCSIRRPRVRLVGPEGDGATALLVHRIGPCGARVERWARPAGAPLAADLSREGADLIVIAGADASALSAVDQVASRIALRPGEGAGCGRVGATPVLWCPLRLEVALALALALIEPCIAYLAGALDRAPPLVAPLTRKVSSSVGFTDIVLLRRTSEGLEPIAVADLTLAALGAADAWLTIAPESEGFAAGATVAAFAL